METVREQEKLDSLLPVYYSVLDPTRVPTSAELDVMPRMLSAVDMAMLSLEVIFAIELPPQAGADLWPRVWVWVKFFQIFRDFLSGFEIDILTEDELCVGFMIFSRNMCAYCPNEAMICSTAGFTAMAVRTWASVLETQDVLRLEEALDNDGLHFVASASAVVEDIVDGAGGSIDDLAALVMSHLSLVAPDVQTQLSAAQLRLIDFVLGIWARIDCMGRGPDCDPTFSKPLSFALISQGVAQPLAITLWTASRTTNPDTASVIEQCLVIFGAIFLTKRGNRVLRVAIQHGFLWALVACGRRFLPDNALLLERVLAPDTVYYHLLADLATPFSELSEIIRPGSLVDSEISRAWATLKRATLHRLEVLRAFDSEDYISRRACDNIQVSCTANERNSIT